MQFFQKNLAPSEGRHTRAALSALPGGKFSVEASGKFPKIGGMKL